MGVMTNSTNKLTDTQTRLAGIKVTGTRGRISALDLAVDLARTHTADGARTQRYLDLQTELRGTGITVDQAVTAAEEWIRANS